MQDTACLGLVHGDDPERCYGEGGGRGVHVWERMYTVVDSCQCMAKQIQYCKVKIKIKKKRKAMTNIESLLKSRDIILQQQSI